MLGALCALARADTERVLVMSAAPWEKSQGAREVFAPIAVYLSHATGASIRFPQAGDWYAYEQALRDNDYDMVFDAVRPVAQRLREHAHELLAKVPGTTAYVIYARQDDADVIELSDFEGRRVGGSRMLGELFDQGRPVGVCSRERRIPVRPRPATFTGAHWLPAHELTLNEDCGAPAPELRVGEPLTRTLRLQAKGLGGAQWPELEMAAPEGIRSYPDQARASSQATPHGVVGTRSRRIAVLAGGAGSVILPAIAVPWRDVDEERQKTAAPPPRSPRG